MADELKIDRDLLPPKKYRMMEKTEEGFLKAGKKHKKFFVEELGLKPDADVLEIGSGNGRIAQALIPYLKDGSYWGLEVMKPFARWCSKAYKNYPNFHFKHINVFNRRYNKFSFTRAGNYTFPFPDDTFDFIYLTSVFTHMRTWDVKNYIKEIARMLKPGGTTFITYFLINKKTLGLIQEKKASRDFFLLEEFSYTDSTKIPEFAIAYDETFILQLYAENSLLINQNGIQYGRWRDPETFRNIKHNQDRITAMKPKSNS